jgi:hypothetical protein
MREPTLIEATQALTTQGFGWDGGTDKIVWPETNTGDAPTRAKINAKLVELQAEYDAQEYARNRASEYPSLLELTVALYDTDDKSAVEAKRAEVKAKFPKPS